MYEAARHILDGRHYGSIVIIRELGGCYGKIPKPACVEKRIEEPME